MKKHYIKVFKTSVVICFLLFYSLSFLLSCTKKEYQRAEHGLQIPYIDSINVTLKEYISKSNSPILKMIWQKGEIDEFLNYYNKFNESFTVIIPTDNAFLTQGWTMDKIASSTKEEVRDIMLSHISLNSQDLELLKNRLYNTQFKSLYKYSDILINYSNDFENNGLTPYYYSFYASFQDDKFYLNGELVSLIKNLHFKDAQVYIVDRFMDPPKISTWDYLTSNPNFTIYCELLEKTDSIYNYLFKKQNGFYAINATNSLVKSYHRDSKKQYGLYIEKSLTHEDLITDINTVFIPTNEAFKRAGFESVDELLQFNIDYGLPHFEWVNLKPSSEGFYIMSGEFATNLLLDYHHNWGARYFNIPQAQLNDGYSQHQLINNIMIFSNEFLNDEISLYPIAYTSWYYTQGVVISRSDSKFYYMPLVFTSNSIGIKDGKAMSRIGQTNIRTLNGLIHEMNDLILPTNFQ